VRSTRALRIAFAAILLGGVLVASCSHKDNGTAPREQQELPALVVRDDTPNLLLTWIDEKGDTHVEVHPRDVPAGSRGLVRVVMSDKDDGTRDLFYVVDLDKRRDDGGYAARTMPRREWETEIEHRRDAYLAKTAPPKAPPPAQQGSGGAPGPTPPADRAPNANVQVIIYGASWCKPCHQAADYLRSKGIAYVLKDVDEDPAAAAEMRDKLEKAGQRGAGSIPVIDVRGQILIGFSARAIDRALAKAASGTVL
jgi:glutaredoxin